jgi:hypothetical protein
MAVVHTSLVLLFAGVEAVFVDLAWGGEGHCSVA